MEQTQTNDFLATEKLSKLMLKYALPCVISLLVGALYNIVDQLFIANADYLGSFGNAANTVVFPLTVVALSIATMIGDGCCAHASISLGARDEASAAKSVGNAIVLSALSGIVLMLIYLIFMDPILVAFGATVNEQTYAMAKEYFFYIAIGVPFYMFGQALNPVIRSDGSPRFAMISLLAGAVCNIILDPIFIFPLKWGMMGAAVATVIGQVLSAAFAFWYLFRMKAVKLTKDCFRLDGGVIKKMLPLGLTSFLSQISIVFSMAAVLNMCRVYGAKDAVFSQAQYAQIPTAVIGIVLKFFQIIMAVSIGIAAGCIPIIGCNMGANNRLRADALMKRLLISEAIVGAIATILFELFPAQLISIFGAGSESEHYTRFAMRAIRLILCATTLSCVNKGAFICLQSLGKAFGSTMLSLLREIVCGVGLVLILPLWFALDGVLYFMPLSDIITFAAVAIVIINTGRELRAPMP